MGSKIRVSRRYPWIKVRRPFQPQRWFASLLPPDLLAPVEVAASAGTAPSGRLADAWRASGASYKWLHYFPIYERELAPLAGTGPRILEIGVAGGGSLGMWRSYLGGGSTVVGIDIDPACARFEDCDRGIHVRVGSQADPQFLQRVVAELGPFDAIIDDGSHVVSHMIAAFGALFFAGLRRAASTLSRTRTPLTGNRTATCRTPSPTSSQPLSTCSTPPTGPRQAPGNSTRITRTGCGRWRCRDWRP
jgi:hypothetical protein